MGLFGGKKRKRRKAVELALEADAGNFSALDDLDATARGLAFADLGQKWLEAGDKARARDAIERALDGDDENFDALATLAEIELADPTRKAEATDAHRRLLALDPSNAAVRAEFVILLLQTNEIGEADETMHEDLATLSEADPLFRLGRELFGVERSDLALPFLTAAHEASSARLRQATFVDGGAHDLVALHREIHALRDEVAAEMTGRDQAIVQAAADGELDPRASGNYALLAESLMAASTYEPAVVTLETTDATDARGKSLVEDGEVAAGLVLSGSAALRRGREDLAEDFFDRAREADGGCFAAFLGLAATMAVDQLQLYDAIDALPDLPAPPAFADVVADAEALTALETRVLVAAVHPLRGALAGLAAAGAKLRLLPVDVRAADLPELEAGRDEQLDDDRAVAALDTVGTGHLMVVRSLDGLDIVSPRGWTAAVAFARLVEAHLPPDLRTRATALFDAAQDADYLFDAFLLSDRGRFFGACYADFVRQRYGTPAYRELDEDDILAEVFDFFRELENDTVWG